MTVLDREGRSELHYAACDANLALVRSLVSSGVDVNLQDRRGWSPLHFAAQANSPEVALFLIQRGALVDAEDSYGNTPLSTATFNSRGRGEVIQVLRAAGADPRKKNKHGVSALALARTIANFDVAQFYDDISDPA